MNQNEQARLAKSIKELRKLELDLSEVDMLVALDYQVKRLGKILDRMESDSGIRTNIHGSGTGRD